MVWGWGNNNSGGGGFHPFGGRLRGTIFDTSSAWSPWRPAPRMTATQVGPTTYRPPPGSASQTPWGQGSWWNTPGVQFQPAEGGGRQIWNPTAGSWEAFSAPDWLGDYDPAEFYDLYQNTPEEWRSSLILGMQSRAEDEQNARDAQAAGRQWLQSQLDQVNAGADSWAADPSREMAMEALRTRADPGYEAFSTAERSAAAQPLARNAAITDMLLDARAASQGGGGLGMQNSAIARGQMANAGTQLQAQFDIAERNLQEQALRALAQLTPAYQNVDLAYLNAGNQLSGALGQLEMGVDFEPTDFTIWPTIAQATRDAESEAAFRMDALQQLEQESRFNIQDLVEMLLSSSGSGVWDLLL